MGTSEPAQAHLNWDFIGLPRIDLHFSEAELHSAVFEMPGEKAPGPDGFNGKFFKRCWDIIKDDMLAALNQMHALKGDVCGLLNTANPVLLPMKDAAPGAQDYRPIRLVQSVSKFLSKMLANRLAPELDKLVSNCKSAFIRGRTIQDNFLYVKNVARTASTERIPTIFLKLDLAKSFDSLNWAFLLEVLKQF
ncbi:hypothetical protein ACQ4PT_015732 [Festuca glaucescens]